MKLVQLAEQEKFNDGVSAQVDRQSKQTAGLMASAPLRGFCFRRSLRPRASPITGVVSIPEPPPDNLLPYKKCLYFFNLSRKKN